MLLVQRAKADLFIVDDKDRPEALLNFEFVRHRASLEMALRSFEVNVAELLKAEFNKLQINIQ